MKQKTQSEIRDELPLEEQIGYVLVEYAIVKKDKYPFTDWLPLIAWEVKVTIEDVKKELKKMFV